MEHQNEVIGVYQIVSFSMTFSDHNPGFKVTVFFQCEYLENGVLGIKFPQNTNSHNQYVKWYHSMTMSDPW